MVEPLQEPADLEAIKLPAHSPIALGAGQDEVPHPVDVRTDPILFEGMGKEVIDIWPSIPPVDANVGKAVETCPLLIPV